MPLVRIDVQRGRTREQLDTLAQVIQDVIQDVFAAPEGDRYQVITQHDAGDLIALDTGLGIQRSDGVTVIQITYQGRSREQKQALYAALADRLGAAGAVRPEDLIVSLVENTKEDWSFGFGQAQFLTGAL